MPPAVPLAMPLANAVVCNDIEVVFARGTREAPGIGRVGEAFVSDLRLSCAVGRGGGA